MTFADERYQCESNRFPFALHRVFDIGDNSFECSLKPVDIAP